MADAKNLFEALVREHAGSLTAYLRSVLHSSTDVDDLFQETMIVAWRRLDDFDQSRPFGPWLRGIARNLVLAHGRSLSRRRCTSAMHEQIEVRLSQLSSRPGDTWQDKLDLVHECVEALPDHYRQVVRLRYFHRKAVKQVAQALSVNVNAVKKRLQRARLLLLDCIEMKLEIDECEA